MAVGKQVIEAITPDDGVAKSADNIRKATGRTTVRSRLSQNPNKPGADKALPVSVARQLAFGTDADRAQLRSIIAELTPQAQINLQRSIALETRDPRSPRESISLTPEGQMLIDIAFNNAEPPKEVLDQIVRVNDPAAGVPLDSIPAGDDASPKSAPQKPKAPEGVKLREQKDEPSFRSKEVLVENSDGTFRVDHKDVHLDRQTASAIRNANRGEVPGVVGDGAALAASKAPLENYTQLLMRTAEVRSPHSNLVEGDVTDGGVPGSVFSPKGSGKKRVGKSLATVNPADHQRLISLARRRGIENPNQFDSPEDFARALVAGADQEGFNITPITASDRARATDRVSDLSDDPASVSDAVVGREMRQYEPGAVSATKAAERALLQEQTIEALARKAEAVFGLQGWGANYKGTRGSAGVDGPSTEGPSLTGTSRNVNDIPAQRAGDVADQRWDEDAQEWVDFPGATVRPDYSFNKAGEPYPMPPGYVTPGKPGTEFDPELTDDDLVDMHNKMTFAEGDPNATGLPNSEAESIAGRTFVDKPYRKPPERNGAYEDDTADFSQYNRENVTMTDSDVSTRMDTYDRLKDTMPLDAARSSEVLKRIKAITEGAADRVLTAEESAEIAALQSQLRMTQRLDEMAGVRSFEAAPEAGDIPQGGGLIVRQPSNPADLMVHNLEASNTDIPYTVDAKYWDEATQSWTTQDPYGLDGRPKPSMGRSDAPPPVEPPRRLTADQPASPPPPRQTPDAAVPPAKRSLMSRLARGAGLAGAGLLGYHLIRQGGKPESADFDYYGGQGQAVTPEQMGFSPDAMESTYGGGIRPILTSSEDRIRAAQQAISRLKLNADTQTPSNWRD
jgi:hypothetical protein